MDGEETQPAQPTSDEDICQCPLDAFERRCERDREKAETASAPADEQTNVGIQWYDPDTTKGWAITEMYKYDKMHRTPNMNEWASWALVVRGKGEDQDIQIMSAYVQQVLKSQLSYTPDTSFDGQSISINWPYSTLFFHLDRLNKYVQDTATEEERLEFDSLNKFYDQRVRAFHEEVRSGLSESSVRFKNLWALFEPGTLLYLEDEFEQPRLYMIGACTTRRPKVEDFADLFLKSTSSRLSTRFCVDAWCINWDKGRRLFSRDYSTFVIPEYSGTRAVTSFPVYPVKYWNGDLDQMVQQVADRGFQWKKYMSEKPCCRQYSGPAIELLPQLMTSKSKKSNRTHLSDRIIVDNEDMVVTNTMLPGVSMPELGDSVEAMMTTFDALGGKSEKRVQSGSMNDDYASFDSHPADKPFDPLQARLSPGSVTALALFDQNGYQVPMQYMNEVQWSTEPFDALVMDPVRKETLRGLVDQHAKNKERIRGDFIKGKGRGLVMVLHGPPGVGKTLTAEALAEHTKKPLLSVNVGELTLDNLGNRFRDVFKKATRWDAVLLIDEADVLLEKRSYENLTRNGLVSVFLRMLEYYEGLLFLTTNRLTTIDPAFHSRIQLAIDYPPLVPATRAQIWHTFLDRLPAAEVAARAQIWHTFLDRLPAAEVAARAQIADRLDDICHWPLNGREIRNVILLAQSLAWNQERRAGALRFAHVERVARETLQFQEIFQTAEYESKARLGVMGITHGGAGSGRAWPSGRQF